MEEGSDYAVEPDRQTEAPSEGGDAARDSTLQRPDRGREVSAPNEPPDPDRGGNGAPRARLLNARDATEYLGISLSTLNRIEKRGLLVPFRTPGGHRRYAQSMLDEYLETTRKPPAQDGAGE